MGINFRTIGSFIVPHSSWKLMGSVAVGGVVCTVARRVLSDYSRLLPAGLGILTSGLSLYILTRPKSTNICPSAKLSPKEAAEANDIIRQLGRNEIVLEKIPIPELIAYIQKLLTSDRMSDIRACTSFIDPKAVVGLQIGGSKEWLLPEGVSESESLKIVIRKRKQRQTTLFTNKNRCADILAKLGIKEDENRLFANIKSLVIRVEDSKVSRVTLYPSEGNDECIVLKDRPALRCVQGIAPLPTPCAAYTLKQQEVAEIYLNTIVAQSMPLELARVVIDSDFSKVLEKLVSFAFENECISLGPMNYRNGVSLDIIDTVELCKAPFVSNSDKPNRAVFDLQKVKELPKQYGIPLLFENHEIFINFESVRHLLTQVAEIIALDRLKHNSQENSWDIPPELKHDDHNHSEIYNKNTKFLTWHGPSDKKLLGYVHNASNQGDYLVKLNLTAILETLPKPDYIKSIKMEIGQIVFVLKDNTEYFFSFPAEPKEGDAKKSFARPRWNSSPS